MNSNNKLTKYLIMVIITLFLAILSPIIIVGVMSISNNSKSEFIDANIIDVVEEIKYNDFFERNDYFYTLTLRYEYNDKVYEVTILEHALEQVDYINNQTHSILINTKTGGLYSSNYHIIEGLFSIVISFIPFTIFGIVIVLIIISINQKQKLKYNTKQYINNNQSNKNITVHESKVINNQHVINQKNLRQNTTTSYVNTDNFYPANFTILYKRHIRSIIVLIALLVAFFVSFLYSSNSTIVLAILSFIYIIIFSYNKKNISVGIGLDRKVMPLSKFISQYKDGKIKSNAYVVCPVVYKEIITFRGINLSKMPSNTTTNYTDNNISNTTTNTVEKEKVFKDDPFEDFYKKKD